MFKKKNVLKFILGLKIKQLRDRRGLSLKELADHSNLSISYLHEIENGKKYPKIEKLHALAESLEIDVGELVSFKTGRNLHPLLKFLESGNIEQIPLELFGLSPTDVLNLMSQSPEKFASFVLTILQVSRSFDVKLDDVYQAALRSYIEAHENYFPDLEKMELPHHTELGFKCDEETLATLPLFKGVKVLVRTNDPHTIYLNAGLSAEEKKFYLLKETGRIQLMKLQTGTDEFSRRLLDFKASYLAGAVIVPEKALAGRMKSFFKTSTFSPQFFEEMLIDFQATPKTLFARLTQILPAQFKLHELFYLELYKGSDNRYEILSELHLSQLHSPHGMRMNETYCERWVAIRSIELLKNEVCTIGQISVVEDGKEYFSLSMSYFDRVLDQKQSVTIGFLINDELKKHMSFLRDEKHLARTFIAQTCERCSKLDCNDRKSDARIHLSQKRSVELQHSINSFLS